MKKRNLKLFAVLLAVLSLFALFSCGKDNDTLKEDAFEQFNESVEELKTTFLGDSEVSREEIIDSFQELDFSVDEIDIGKNPDYSIESISVKNGTFYLQGVSTAASPEKSKNYAGKIYDNAISVFELVGDGAFETSIPLSLFKSLEQPSKLSDILEAIKIDEDDFKEISDHQIELKKTYTKRVAKALRSCGFEEAASLFDGNSINVDTSSYETKKEIVFSDSWNEESSLLILSFDKLDGVHTIGIRIENDKDSTTKLTLKIKDKQPVEFVVDIGDGKEYFLLEFSVSEQKSDVKRYKKYNIDLWVEVYTSEFELIIDADGHAYENKDGELSQICVNIKAQLDEKDILSGTITYDEDLRKKKGEEVFALTVNLYEVDVNDLIKDGITTLSSSDEGENYTFKFTVKTEEYTKSKCKYKFAIELTEKDEKEAFSVVYSIPATNVPTLTKEEKNVIDIADDIYDDYEACMEKAQEINDEAISALERGKFYPIRDGYKIYTEHKKTGIFFLTDVSIVDGSYYITTRPAADYKKYLPICSENLGDFESFEPSLASLELSAIVEEIDTFAKDGYGGKDKNFTSYVYLENSRCYAVMDKTRISDVQYLWEKPTADMFPDYVLHEIKKADDGYSLHDYSLHIDDGCILRYVCTGCGSYKKSTTPQHQYKELERINDVGGENLKLTYCERCDIFILEFNDEEGEAVTLNLTLMNEEHLNIIQSIAQIDGYEISDINKCLFISDVNCKSDTEKSKTIEIPQTEEIYGYKIIGVEKNCGYQKSIYNVKLVLPEGVEIIMDSAFYLSGFCEIVLPESLLYIGTDAFRSCAVSELVIPKGVVYIDSTAFNNMNSLRKLTINAENIELIPPVVAKNLEELEINSSSKIFVMFRDCKITEYEIPEGIESVQELHYNDTLKKLVLPTTLISLYDDIFFSSISYETLVFKGEYSFGLLPKLSVGEITYQGAITSEITFGKITNIYTTELPESDGAVYDIPSNVRVINFAGSESEFLLAGYNVTSDITVVNYNVVFEN